MKTLLVISGGIEAVEGIRIARKKGFRVIVSDGNPAAPGFKFADEKIIASTYDEKLTAREALRINRRVRIDGVITIASDVPYTVAYVAGELHLKSYSRKIAALCSDKLALKSYLAKKNITLPWFSRVASAKALKAVIAKKGYPLVIKPVDNRGARGVLRITPDIDPEWAFHESRSYSPSKRVIVEEWLYGIQISTESVVWDGAIVTPGSSDRNYEFLDRYKPYVIENGGELPCSLTSRQWRQVERLLERAIRSLGTFRGTIKGDIVFTQDGPRILELAPRLSGGYFCSQTIPLATGVDLVGAAFDIALGKKPVWSRLKPARKRYVVQRFFFPGEGLVKRISYVERAKKMPGVRLLKVYVRKGDRIKKPTCHPERAGMVVTTGATPQEAMDRAKKVISTVSFELDKG